MFGVIATESPYAPMVGLKSSIEINRILGFLVLFCGVLQLKRVKTIRARNPK